jgi:hypothetical protein
VIKNIIFIYYIYWLNKMVRELKNKLFLAITLMSVLVLITGCGSNTNVSKKYYTGYDSIEMKFLEDSPPAIFYYDSEADFASQVNTIPINVEMYNKGSSDSYGALFVSGFDPNLVAVQGYTNNYPGYTSAGQYRPSTQFSGYFDDSNNFLINAFQIPTDNGYIDLGISSVNGRTALSFASLGKDRTELFNRLSFDMASSRYAGYSAISTGVMNARIGAALNPITRGMFNSYGWGDWLKKFELEGRNNNNPSGGMTVVPFPTTLLDLPASLEEFTQPIQITSCFDYATHATAMVCIDPEPNSNVAKICRANTVSLASGQGAPVAITSVEQRPAKGRTTFVINVHLNKKTGDLLYDYFSLYKCDPAAGGIVKSTDLNVVYIGYVYLSGNMDITMNCLPDQIIRLDQSGNGQITCSVDFLKEMAPTGAYKAPLEIELWYGYSKTIFRNVLIKRI